MTDNVLQRLAALISARRAESTSGSDAATGFDRASGVSMN